MTELSDLEAKLGYRFTRHALLVQALTHGSVRHEQQTGDCPEGATIIEDNERLEFLGDAIVGMVMAELLYRRYPELDEGELTRLRAALVSRRHLGVVGAGLELGGYLHLGRAEERNGGRSKAVLLANCIEALIGALYLEGGLPAAAEFVERAIAEPYMDRLRGELRENSAIGDYKTALQELLQSRRAGQPEYVVQAESGPDHRKRFLVEVRVDTGKQGDRAQAEGTTKKKAEQEAARLLYHQMTGRHSAGEIRAKEIEIPAHDKPEDRSPAAGATPSERKHTPVAAPLSAEKAALPTLTRVLFKGVTQRLPAQANGRLAGKKRQ